MKVDSLLYAGNSLDKAREVFAKAIKHRPRINLTIRQRTRVLDSFSRNAGSYFPRPRPRSQTTMSMTAPIIGGGAIICRGRESVQGGVVVLRARQSTLRSEAIAGL
jgi:hypothetical protein